MLSPKFKETYQRQACLCCIYSL